MADDDHIFDEEYVETTVSIGQTLPFVVFVTTSCLVFMPVISLSLRPSNEDIKENGERTKNFSIKTRLEEKIERTEFSPLVSPFSANSSEYGGLARGSDSSKLHRLGSRGSSPRKTLCTLDSLDEIQDDEVGLRNALKFSDPRTSAVEKLKIVTVNICDAQSKSMLNIGFPYLIQTLASAISELIQMGVVGHQLGTEALTAYVIIDLFLKLTTDAVSYIISSGSTLIAQVVESEDNKKDQKIGIYLMLSIVFYVIGMIPLMVLWCCYMEDFLLFLGLDTDMAEEGQRFAIAYIIMILISGIASSFQYILDVVGFQKQTTVMVLLGEVFATSCIVLLMCCHGIFPNPSLVKMGWVYVMIDACYLATMLGTIHYNGWLENYYAGFFSSPLNIFRNWSGGGSETGSGASIAAVKLMISNAIQYAFANLVFEGEWQVLLLFAGMLGSAELAAWGVLGIIWEELEDMVSAISEGCGVRVALSLGNGDTNTAKLISYKAIWISTIWGILVSIVFLLFEDRIPILITSDPLLQEMVSYNLPSIALANLVSGIALMADHILYCQNRTGLATGIAIGTSLLITIPLAGLSSWYLHLNLIGQTTAVALGASVFAALSLYAVVSSDWKQVAENIRLLHRDDEDSIADELEDSFFEKD